MPRVKKHLAPRRLSLKISGPVNDRLERLCEQTEAENLTEVIRRALATYDALWEAHKNGEKILIQTNDGQRELMLI